MATEEIPTQKADLALVLAEVEKIEDCATHAKKMLLEGLPRACAPVAEGAERHRYQAAFAAMAQEMLTKATGALAESKAASASEGAQAKEAAATLADAVTKATEAKTATKDVVTEKKTAESDAKAECATTEKNHKRVSSAYNSLKNKRAKIEKDKAHAVEVSDVMFAQLSAGTFEGAQGPALKSIKEILESAGAEHVMLTAVPQALKMKPEDRGDFDKTTLGFGADLLKKKVAEFETKLTEGAAAVEEAWAEMLGLWAVADVVRDRVAAAHEELTKAKAELDKKSEELETAESEAAAQEKKTKAAAKAEKELADQESDLIAATTALTRMLTGDYPKPVEEKEPEAPAETPAEAPAEPAAAA